MSWAGALKEYAVANGKFLVPKKGTPEYDAVATIHRRMKGIEEPAPEKPKRGKKAVVAPVEEAPVAPNKDAELEALHKIGIKEKKAAKDAQREVNRAKHAEEKTVRAEKEDRYTKLEAEVAEIKKHVVVKKDIKETDTFKKKVVEAEAKNAEKEKMAAAKKNEKKAKAPRKLLTVENKPVLLTFSD